MRLQRYFERIRFSGNARPDVTTLEALQRAHVTHVPFENLDVQLGRHLSIDVPAAYAKIVERRRGGWCYEQNGLFGWALKEIGFAVTRVAGAVMRQEGGDAAAANHLCLLVRCDDVPDAYLADVGFGSSLIRPIPLKPAEHQQPPFRIGLERVAAGGWRFWEDLGAGRFSYDFAAQPADETALAAKCDILQRDPASTFVQNAVVQRREPDRHIALRGRILRVASENVVTDRCIDSADAYVTTLNDVFDLDVPEAAGLWPRIVVRHDAHRHRLSET